MDDVVEKLIKMWRAAEYDHETVGEAIDEIERLWAVVDAVTGGVPSEIAEALAALQEKDYDSSD